MGSYVSFFRTRNDQELKELIFDCFETFRKVWVANEEYFYTETNELDTYFRQNRNIREDFYTIDKKLADQLTTDSYLNLELIPEYKNIFEQYDQMMKTWRFEKSTEMVLKTRNEQFIRLWDHLVVKGRSLRDDSAIQLYSGEYFIGFLSYEEQMCLRQYIEEYFGTNHQMMEHYWTEEEKKQLDDALANRDPVTGNYSLSSHNPGTEGLEFILRILTELEDDKRVLYSAIEMYY